MMKAGTLIGMTYDDCPHSSLQYSIVFPHVYMDTYCVLLVDVCLVIDNCFVLFSFLIKWRTFINSLEQYCLVHVYIYRG